MTKRQDEDHEGRRDDRRVTRRAMLCWASGAAALAGTASAGPSSAPATGAAIAAPAPAALHGATGMPGRVSVGPLAAFPPASRIAIDTLRLCIVRDGNGVAAISTTCTHLGCIAGPVDAGFACPCHGSRFDRNGVVIGGPAPASLQWYALRLAPDGGLEVDTSVEVEPGTYLTV